MHRRPRSTSSGEHRPVLLDEVLAALDVQPGAIVVDCTTGWAGHGVELLRRRTEGRLIGLDLDADNLPQARERLAAVGFPFGLHHANFAALPTVLAAAGVAGADALLADLGMSSMQVDDAGRGFSYVRDGPLDMRMDRTRGRTATQILATISHADLAQALLEYGDEPDAGRVAELLIEAREKGNCGAPATWPASCSTRPAPDAGGCTPRSVSGTCTPRRGRFRHCASSSTASWRTWSNCYACCRMC